MADPWENLTLQHNCQMMGIIENLITSQPLSNNEIDAIKRRLFAFPDEMDAHNIEIPDIQQISTPGQLSEIINTLSTEDILTMFW